MPCAKLCRPFFVYTYFLFVVCPLPYAFVIPPVYHQGYDTMTLYNITFSKNINSVTNNNAIYVWGVSIILSVMVSYDDKLSHAVIK